MFETVASVVTEKVTKSSIANLNHESCNINKSCNRPNVAVVSCNRHAVGKTSSATPTTQAPSVLNSGFDLLHCRCCAEVV